MSKEEIEKKVIEIVADELGVNASELSAGTNLQDDLGADSLDAVEILCDLEHEYNIELPNYDVFNTDLKTIAEITTFVYNHLNS